VASELVLYAGCMARLAFGDFVSAAADAGFDAITVWPNTWRHAMEKEGLTLAGMRAVLDDAGVVLTDSEGCNDWTPGPAEENRGPRFRASRHDVFGVTTALGGTTVAAIHQSAVPFQLDRDAEAFARLCDDAAEHGLRVAIEFVPFTQVPDAATAWALLETAGRSNSGVVVDTWHHFRRGADAEALARIPADRIFAIQVSDGPRVPPAVDLATQARTARLPPGQGEMDVAAVLVGLAARGVYCPVGPELATEYLTRPPAAVARELADATKSVLTPDLGVR
jgi:sugar phosphate isomerase/epimerase